MSEIATIQHALKCHPSKPNAMNPKIALSPRLYFSYGQFMVYDESVDCPDVRGPTSIQPKALHGVSQP